MFRRQKWNLISRSQVSLEEASTSIDRALNATLSQLFSARNGSELSPEALTQLRFPPESEREVAKAAEIYERALQLVFERVKNAGDSIAEVTPKNFTYLDIISPGGLSIAYVLSYSSLIWVCLKMFDWGQRKSQEAPFEVQNIFYFVKMSERDKYIVR